MKTKETIIKLIANIDRPGITKLLKFLETSTFFTDPASCNEHNSYEGGLADHSLNVYNILNTQPDQVPVLHTDGWVSTLYSFVGYIPPLCQSYHKSHF